MSRHTSDPRHSNFDGTRSKFDVTGQLWTTRYLDAAVEQLRALPADQREHPVLDEDVARLSPLKHANLNVLGRYSFRSSGPAGGALGPLRDPGEADDDEDAED